MGDARAATEEEARKALRQARGQDVVVVTLESSLRTCTAQRDSIEQMLRDEPGNRELPALRDQLSIAVAQLQGTKEQMQRLRAFTTGRPR